MRVRSDGCRDRLCRRYNKEALKHFIGDQAAARRESDLVGGPSDEAIAFQVGEDGMDGLDGCRTEFGAEVAEVKAAVGAKSEEPGFLELFFGGEAVGF